MPGFVLLCALLALLLWATDTQGQSPMAVASPPQVGLPTAIPIPIPIPIRTDAVAEGIGFLTGVWSDALPLLTIDDAAVEEGPPGEMRELVFQLRLSAPASDTVTLQIETTSASAVEGVDYTRVSGGITFATFGPGTLEHTVRVPVIGDAVAEPDETMLLQLSRIGNARLDRPWAIGTILDDDGAVILVGDAEVAEEDGRESMLSFPVTVSGVLTQAVALNYQTVSGTALEGQDFLRSNGRVFLLPGKPNALIRVPVRPDRLPEVTEHLELRLSCGPGATLRRNTATGWILDHDLPTISVTSTALDEGSDKLTRARFVINLSSPRHETVSVSYETRSGTATAGRDFIPASGTLLMPPGTVSAVLEVTVMADTVHEGDEVFGITLSNPVGALLGAGSAEGVIRDDDPAPLIQVGDARVVECSGTGAASAVFTARLTAASELPVSFTARTLDFTAAANRDYLPVQALVRFDPGTTDASVSVPILCDGDDEPTEAFKLLLGNAVHGHLPAAWAWGQIVDDDGPVVSTAPARWTEGTTGTLVVELSSPSDEYVWINYATVPGTATTPGDFLEARGTLVFPPGTARQVVPVSIVDDDLTEPDESLTVRLDAAVGATVSSPEVAVVLGDNDLPIAAWSDVVIVEGHAGTRSAVVSVRLSRSSTLPARLRCITVQETAASPGDFVVADLWLTLPPGVMEAEVPIGILGDRQMEDTESLLVRITESENVIAPREPARITILDDDVATVLSVSGTRLVEGNDGVTEVSLRLHLSDPLVAEVPVRYVFQPGSALESVDYLASEGTLTFPPGSTEQGLPLRLIADLLDEADETLELLLTVPANITLVTNRVPVVVMDDDESRVGVADARVETRPGGVRAAVFPITLSSPSSLPVTVEYTTADGTARAGLEYVARAGTLVLEPGETRDEVRVALFAPPPAHALQFQLRLLATAHASIESDTAVARLEPDAGSSEPPDVRLISPRDGDAFPNGTSIPLVADAVDADGGISEVRWFAGSLAVARATGTPYSGVWLHPPAGSHLLTAQATDNSGLVRTSTPVRIQVLPPEEPAGPSIRLVAPDRLGIFPPGTPVTVQGVTDTAEADILRVEILRAGELLAFEKEAPYRWVWLEPPAGEHTLVARLVLRDGRTADSDPLRFSVADVCGRVALVAAAPTAEIEYLRDHLHAMGVDSRAIGRSEVSEAVLASYDAVIWHDGGAPGMVPEFAAVFRSLALSGKALYFIGARLLDPPGLEMPTLSTEWMELIHLQPDPSRTPNGNIEWTTVAADSEFSPLILQGFAGEPGDIAPPESPGAITTGRPGEGFVGRSGGSAVLVAFQDPATPSGRRSVTQLFPTLGPDGPSTLARKTLFQNAMAWLLRCPSCDNLNLLPSVETSQERAMPGDEIRIPIRLGTSGGCEALDVRLTCALPPELQFLGASTPRGSWSEVSGVVTVRLGRLARGSTETVEIRALARAPGPGRCSVQAYSLNEPAGAQSDNAVEGHFRVAGVAGSSIRLRSRGAGEVSLVVEGTPGESVTVETASRPSGPWSIWTRLTLGPEGSELAIPIIAPEPARFFRIRL